MLARRTTTALVGLTVFTNAFQQLPRHALRPVRRRAADGDDDDFDFEAAFKARVEEVQSIDVVEAVFGDEGPPLDLEKMAILGKEAAGVGVAAIVGALLLLFSGIFFTQSKSPLKEQPVENVDPGVCLSGKCANGAKNVKALEFTSDRFADDRNAARAENPEPFLE
jgi:hypothetical protein